VIEPAEERVAQRLAARLEELARACERAGAPREPVARLLESASVATMHAVSLELLTAERASGIWTDAVERHPLLEDAPAVRPTVERLAA
jgi:hypothetical protein